ncbi:hypothetical protein ACH5RR_013194 [Cinchona calisaya]|uniref:Uncharacterized protein n=1 Tax=Cinchona calisaya TaxID=153742 RepID=A0ABD3A2Z1_9GENT
MSAVTLTTSSPLHSQTRRFILCRAVLTLFCLREVSDQYLPVCVPEFPTSLSPSSDVLSAIFRLAKHLKTWYLIASQSSPGWVFQWTEDRWFNVQRTATVAGGIQMVRVFITVEKLFKHFVK